MSPAAAYVRSLSSRTDHRVIAGAGHFIAQEQPAESNATLAETLRKICLIAKRARTGRGFVRVRVRASKIPSGGQNGFGERPQANGAPLSEG